MKHEFSAGGIVYRKLDGEIYILMCQHAGYGHWGFPKGHIGDKIEGESKEETAIREVKEETGIDAEIIEALDPIEYWYIYKGEKRKKTVYFYLMSYLGGDFSHKDHEMQAVDWIPLPKVLEKITYDSERMVFSQARVRVTLLEAKEKEII